MLNSVGIRDGMMFMQCLVEDGECVVYDIGYRLTGSLEYILQEEIYGYNPLTLMIQYALTGKTLVKTNTSELTPFWKKYACNVSFLIKPGTIGEIHGLDKIKRNPKVIDAVLSHVEGDNLPESVIGTLRQIVLRVFAVADTKEELADLMDEIYNCLEVRSTQGENLLLEGLDTREIDALLI